MNTPLNLTDEIPFSVLYYLLQKSDIQSLSRLVESQHLPLVLKDMLSISHQLNSWVIFELLLKKNPIDHEYKNGMTLLMLSAQLGSESMINYLLKQGANPNLKCHKQWSAYDYASNSY
jgi:ankyrin repeat protein